MFHPSPASVTTSSYFRRNTKISKSFVNVHRDGIPPEDLASFSCLDAGTSLPVTERISTVLTTAGSLSLSPVPSLKLARSDSELAIKDITKALELLEGCNHSDSGVVLWHVDALITRCELSVLRNSDSSKAKELEEWVKKMQDMYTRLLQMSAFGKDYPELRVRIQQLQEKVEL